MNEDKSSPVPGRLYGVGVGPGDPELLTLKAYRVLRQVPVVCAPQSRRGEESYALTIVRDLIDPARQEVLHLLFPMSRNEAELQEYWAAAAAAIAGRLRAGRDCAFLTEGDPFLYSTFVYVFNAMRERYPDLTVEVVPGVSSVNAAAARSLLPLARADERVAILPATGDGLAEALRGFDAAVLLKVSRVFDRVVDALEELGLAEQAVLVQRVTTGSEVIVRDIRSLRGQKLDYFSLLIIPNLQGRKARE